MKHNSFANHFKFAKQTRYLCVNFLFLLILKKAEISKQKKKIFRKTCCNFIAYIQNLLKKVALYLSCLPVGFQKSYHIWRWPKIFVTNTSVEKVFMIWQRKKQRYSCREYKETEILIPYSCFSSLIFCGKPCINTEICMTSPILQTLARSI